MKESTTSPLRKHFHFFRQSFGSQKISAYFFEKCLALYLQLDIRQNSIDTSPGLIEVVV